MVCLLPKGCLFRGGYVDFMCNLCASLMVLFWSGWNRFKWNITAVPVLRKIDSYVAVGGFIRIIRAFTVAF